MLAQIKNRHIYGVFLKTTVYLMMFRFINLNSPSFVLGKMKVIIYDKKREKEGDMERCRGGEM